MLVRTVRWTRDSPSLARTDGLRHPRFEEVWSRHARTAALALRTSSALTAVRHDEEWAVTGRHGGIDGDLEDGMLREVEVAGLGEEVPRRHGTSRGIGIAIRTGDTREEAVLCVLGTAPRRWSRRERQLLEALGLGLKNELVLRLQLGDPRSHVAGPRSEPEPTVARLNLGPADGEEVHTLLRRSILAAVHEGRAQPGDRLPSIREVADACATTMYVVVQAYKALEDEGIVEKRERSGIFIAGLGETPVRRLPETANWLRTVVADGYLLQVKLPALPDLIQRWTGSGLRCACVEGSEDYRVALCEEVRGQFGLEALDVPIGAGPPAARLRMDSVEAALRKVDLVVTTPFHLPRVRAIAARLDLPLVVATLDDASAHVIRSRLAATPEVTLLCVDPEFGRRMLINLPESDAARVQVATVDSAEDLRRIDRARPVLMTKAARQRLAGEEFRLVLPQYPAFSRRFAERLAHTIIQLNLERLRRVSRPA